MSRVVSTRALTPRAALIIAALMNVAGALISTKVARTVGGGIIEPPSGRGGLVVVLAALLGAIAWNLATWWFGLPSSSSHALISGLIGSALVSSARVKWEGVTAESARLDSVTIGPRVWQGQSSPSFFSRHPAPSSAPEKPGRAAMPGTDR